MKSCNVLLVPSVVGGTDMGLCESVQLLHVAMPLDNRSFGTVGKLLNCLFGSYFKQHGDNAEREDDFDNSAEPSGFFSITSSVPEPLLYDDPDLD